MTAGTLWMPDMLVREHIRLCPEILVLFGDNLKRIGLGGQAKECRGEPNVLGIPTKRLPSREARAFFSDADLDEVAPIIDEAFNTAATALLRGQDVAYPFRGVGSGYARLAEKAPRLYERVTDGELLLRQAASAVCACNNLLAAVSVPK